jgi:transposase
MKQPEVVTATQAELDEILALARTSFPPRQYQLLEGVLGTFVHVMLALQNAKTSIKRFRQMLFGARTELKRNVLDAVEVRDPSPSPAGDPPDHAGAAVCAGDHDGPEPAPRPGHGRNGAQAYRDAPIVECEHHDLQPGDRCPRCATGKVYDSPPRTIVKVVGQAPLAATVYRLQRLRCRLCDAIFTAPLPAAVAALPKYDASCASMIALLRYGNGMPHYRLEGLQASLYAPLPDATQWDIVAKAVPAPRAAFEELIRQAAQAPLLHNDDTPARVLSLMAERAKAEAAGQTPKAKAINTSGIVAVVQERRVVLFFTGHAHAGKNLAQVLAHRAKELEPPMQMCDALASNVAGEFVTVLCNCLTHGRRTVVEVVEHFPQACGHVIETLAKVYEHDAVCRRDKMSPEQRLAFHQDHSAPLMQGLHSWMSEQLEQRQVEPNCGLGQALRYLLKHWSELTLFLRRAGAPLDNNVCERALKRAILHRKNSMFYKTLNGAAVGDIYMSLIHTCRLCDVNPFEYLQALQKHAQDVLTDAALWLPWNYRERRAGAA